MKVDGFEVEGNKAVLVETGTEQGEKVTYRLEVTGEFLTYYPELPARGYVHVRRWRNSVPGHGHHFGDLTAAGRYVGSPEIIVAVVAAARQAALGTT